MVRRLSTLASFLIVLSAIAIQPAHAQGNSQGNGNSQEHGNSGDNGNGGDNSNSDSNGGGSDNSSNGASSNAGGANANSSSNAPAKADKDLALDAVRAEDAVPLQQILQSVRQSTTDKVIDAQLFSVDGVLVYEVKVLAPGGRVSVFHYYAGSGRQFSLH